MQRRDGHWIPQQKLGNQRLEVAPEAKGSASARDRRRSHLDFTDNSTLPAAVTQASNLGASGVSVYNSVCAFDNLAIARAVGLNMRIPISRLIL